MMRFFLAILLLIPSLIWASEIKPLWKLSKEQLDKWGSIIDIPHSKQHEYFFISSQRCGALMVLIFQENEYNQFLSEAEYQTLQDRFNRWLIVQTHTMTTLDITVNKSEASKIADENINKWIHKYASEAKNNNAKLIQKDIQDCNEMIDGILEGVLSKN